MGVEVRLNTLAVDMDHFSRSPSRARTAVETIPARTRIWAAGRAGVTAGAGCSRTRPAGGRPGRRIPVQPDCSLPGHPEVFAIGDMVSLNKLPGVAQPAMQEGKYVAKLIKAPAGG